MELLNLYGVKGKRQARKAKASTKAKGKAKPRLSLAKMTPEQLEALSTQEFERLLSATDRRLYRACEKLKGAF